ncbi:MAG: TRAP transporter large permease subunit [Gammaproteobacteria bacterium]|nr:TRAP transporter large permease subunit [Gammaproteobacteria bacterium]
MTPLLLLVLALLGVPLFAVIALGAIIGFSGAGVDLTVIAIEIYRIAEMPVLIAIPLFTFAGYLLGESNAPDRLVRASNAVLGWLPGNLAHVTILACALFTAFTGASGVTIVAMGALLYPALNQAGYREQFNLGLVTTAGSLGLLFAPALPLILYGVVVQAMGVGPGVSIDDLFRAGVLPGLLMVVLLSGYSMWANRHLVRGHRWHFSLREAGSALWQARWELPLPFIVLGGIYSGYFAVSEAAAVTALYVLVVEVLITREITLSRLVAIMRESMTLVGGIMIILGVSLASTNYMIDTEVPMRIFETVQQYIDSKWTFLALLTVFLLALGMMLDIFSALVLIVPIIFPIAMAYGIHPVHLGILFLANMQLGYITPPVGMNLFIASYRFDRPVLEVYRATLPFFFVLFAAVLLITFYPPLSLVFVAP